MMKVLAITVAFLGLLAILGCEENPAQEYGRALTGSMEKAERTADAANLEALKRSIAAHHAANGAYPESIEEIARAMGLDPAGYTYDPSTGRVALK